MTRAMTKAEYDAHWLKRIFARCVRTDSGGWPADLAYSMGPVPHGYRPLNAKFPRKRKAV